MAMIDSLQATAATRRCSNPYFRRETLKSLHDALRAKSSEIISAIQQDSHVSQSTASFEFAWGIDLVKEQYGSVNPLKELENEHRIARNEDCADAREPWGVVCIHPDQTHTPFFSIISALSTALVSGNVIALKLENTTSVLFRLLRDVLSDALSDDVFTIISLNPPKSPLGGCLQVYQKSNDANQLLSHVVSSMRPVIAIVDRTADLTSAAEALVAARFAFGGTSPYAPDLILVNEFVKEEFVAQLGQDASRFSEDLNELKEGKHLSSKREKDMAAAISQLQSVIPQKSRRFRKQNSICIMELIRSKDEVSVLSLPKVSAPIIVVAAITSLDDAIDLISPSEPGSLHLLASYHFASPKHAKYLAQSVTADATFVNNIPARLLVGPAAPNLRTFDVNSRYLAEHFTRPAPVFINLRTSKDAEFAGNLITGKLDNAIAKQAVARVTKEIKEKKRAESIAIGFFEQGIFIGLGVYGLPVLTCFVAGLSYAIRGIARRYF